MRTSSKFLLLTLLCALLALADLAFGSTDVGLSQLWQLITGKPVDAIEQAILLNIRLPKMLTAILAGVALSVSGLLMQTLFQNPLAGPYILGVSSGATLGVATLLLMGTTFGFATTGQWFIINAAIIGAVSVLLLVLAVSGRVKSNVSLLIIGLMIGNIAGALVNVMQNYSNPDALKIFIV
ncbi:MAG: iron chelate uptake ABC transporter family permease subunit, partial [Paludibacteraceae bacterium]|nr:iron chelate uptake ABC transporter family permease subunit [Paludibacteraceae bacterium]